MLLLFLPVWIGIALALLLPLIQGLRSIVQN